MEKNPAERFMLGLFTPEVACHIIPFYEWLRYVLNIFYSPYNWYKSGSAYAQSPNPGAYLKMGFTSTKISVNVDVSPLVGANVAAVQYPLVRY